jgi:hypothetical protein
MASAEERGGLTIANGLGGESNGGSRLPAERGRRRFAHLNPLRCIDELEIQAGCRGMSRQLALDRSPVAHEQQADLEVPGGNQGASDDAPRRVVTPHRIDG